MIDPPTSLRGARGKARRRRLRRSSTGFAALALLLALGQPLFARGDDAEAAYRQGMESLRAGDLDGAAASFQRAVEIAPDFDEAWLQLGIARSSSQDWEGAIEAYEHVIEIDPENAKALNNLANVYFRQGRHEEASRWYALALEVDRDYLLAAFHYGWVLRELNRPEEAERWFSRCLEIPAKSARERKTRIDCMYYFGALRFRARDYEQAAAIMERVISVVPSHPEARYYLGMSYRQLGRLEEAQEQLEIHNEMTRVMRRSKRIEKNPDP